MEKVKATPAIVVLSHSTLVDSLYPHLSVKDILNLQRVCSDIHGAVLNWIPVAYNVDNHFRRFFDDPVSFRVLQAQTGMLVSGSNALQFFDRTYYPDSDIDLYAPCRNTSTVANWLKENDYDLKPNSKQLRLLQRTTAEAVFEEISGRTFTSRRQYTAGNYGWSSIEEVFTFIHRSKPHLKAQLIVVDPQSSPIACVLHFHSTLVMNFIAWDKAYSLFPSATFLHRISLTFGDISKDARLVPIYAKYSLRGYKITAIPLEAACFAKEFVFCERWINDKQSWVINLHTDDVTAIAGKDHHEEFMPRTAGFMLRNDWASGCSGLTRNPDRFPYTPGAPVICFEEIKSTILKNSLVVPAVDPPFLSRIRTFIDAQEKFQYAQAATLDPATVNLGLPSHQIEGWKYWDREVLMMVRNVPHIMTLFDLPGSC